MKNIAKILLLVFVILAFTTCKNDIQDQYVGGEGGHLPISDMVIHPLGDEISVPFTAFVNWKVDIKNGGNWCTVKSRSGDKGFNDVTFAVEPFFADQGTSKRTAEVVFRNSKTNAVLDSFEVTQSAAYISIAESPEDISFGWDKNYNGNSSNIISVSSSIECKIEIENGDNNQNEWLSVVNVDNNGTLYFGTPGEANNGEFEVTAIDYNFNVANNDATIKIVPVQRDANGNEKTLSDDILKNIVQSISVSQDFLIFTVHEGSVSDVTDVINKVLNLDGFSELGYNYLQINEDDTDDKNASKTITIAIEEGYSYVESDLDDASQTYKFEKIGNVSPIDFSGRTVNLQQYEVRILKPNDKLNEKKEIPIEMSLEGYEDDGIPKMKFNLVQEPYIFKLVDDNEEDIRDVTFGNAGGKPKTYKLKTTGPWTIDDYNQEEWLGLTIKGGKATGVGDAEFTIETTGRNMSFDEDNVATLLFSTGDFNGDLSTAHKAEMSVKQEKFAFDIKVAAAVDDGRELRLTSSNTLPHRINITSSGDWELNVVDNSENKKWLYLNLDDDLNLDKYTGSTHAGFDVWADVNSSDKNSRTVTLELVSILHREAESTNWSEEEYTRKLEITQDELHCAIRPKDGVSDIFTRCDMLAYNKDGLSQSFYLDCSVPWIVDSKPDWITLKLDNREIESGDGMKYLTIDMDVETNKDSSHRSGKVTIKADIDADGEFDEDNDRTLSFDVSQDGFVFNVSASSKYTFGAINTDYIEFTIETTKGAGFTFNDNNDIPDWLGCEEIETGSTEKTDIFKYELKPGHNVKTINKSRECKISIKSDVLGDNGKKEISVKQDAFVFETDKDKLNAFDEMKPDWQSIKVIDCTKNSGKDCYSVELESDTASWLEYKYDSDSGKCEFKPKANNTTTEKRTGTIKFVINHSEVKNEVVLMRIPVTQNPYIWDVNVSGSTSISTLGGDSGIKIMASGEWTIDCPQGVTADPEDGKGANGGKEADVELTFVPNYGDSEKESKVTVKCKDNDLLKKELTFKQTAYTFKVDGKTSDDDIEYIISDDGGSFEIAIECSDPKAWKPECEDGWVKMTENYTDKKLSVTIEQNKDKKEREAVITISTTDNSRRAVNVKIKQEAAK